MIATVYDRATGEFLWQVEGADAVVQAQADEAHGLVEGFWDADAYYVGAAGPDDPVERPVLVLPTERTLAVGQPWQVSAPAGTVVRVDGEVVGTLEENEPLTFDTAGNYAVELAPPFPWVGGIVAVTVE